MTQSLIGLFNCKGEGIMEKKNRKEILVIGLGNLWKITHKVILISPCEYGRFLKITFNYSFIHYPSNFASRLSKFA